MITYLAGRHKLQRPEGSLQVGCVVLEVIESAGDRGLQLGGVLPRRRVQGDLVDGSHYCRRATGSWLSCWGGEGRRVEVVLVVDGREDSINYSRPSRSGRPA